MKNMDTDYWVERWDKCETGFHQNEINPHLKRFWPELGLVPGSLVFVPLCGKTRDMIWLRAQGHEVIGVEISPVAVESFFSENSLPFSITTKGACSVYQAEGFKLYCGDFFQLTSAELSGVSAVFDRASLIALPQPMRNAYAAHMQSVLPSDVKTIMITFDYPQHEMNGPPFSVQESEVNALYGGANHVKLLYSENIIDKETRFRDKGATRLLEQVFLLTRKAG